MPPVPVAFAVELPEPPVEAEAVADPVPPVPPVAPLPTRQLGVPGAPPLPPVPVAVAVAAPDEMEVVAVAVPLPPITARSGSVSAAAGAATATVPAGGSRGVGGVGTGTWARIGRAGAARLAHRAVAGNRGAVGAVASRNRADRFSVSGRADAKPEQQDRGQRRRQPQFSRARAMGGKRDLHSRPRLYATNTDRPREKGCSALRSASDFTPRVYAADTRRLASR